MKLQIPHLIQRCFIVMSLAALLPACAEIGVKKEEISGVAVHAINYSGRGIIIGVVDPNNPNNMGGGEALNPYASGGSVCCFGIPSKWRPDLKVIVDYQFYPDETIHKQLVSVPPYAGGKAGYIWIMLHEDGKAEVVVSNGNPDHAEWPGKIKGYPVASREYRLKLWGEKLRMDKAVLAGMEKAIQGDTSSLSPEELQDLKDAIKSVGVRVKGLEKNKP